MKEVMREELPGTWSLHELGELAQFNPGFSPTQGRSEDMAVSFLPMKAVGAGDGVIDLKEVKHSVFNNAA
ncbi:MAG: hypothetical protein Q8K67_03650 [Geothrix sp.]|nr:hypothetical protein [Geothrix sp.]